MRPAFSPPLMSRALRLELQNTLVYMLQGVGPPDSLQFYYEHSLLSSASGKEKPRFGIIWAAKGPENMNWRKCMGIEPTREGTSPAHRI
jgi:hypothetical protein